MASAVERVFPQAAKLNGEELSWWPGWRECGGKERDAVASGHESARLSVKPGADSDA